MPHQRQDWGRAELAPGLYYATAYETAAGAIEVEAVGGVNAAALAARHLGRPTGTADPTSTVQTPRGTKWKSALNAFTVPFASRLPNAEDH